MDARFVTEAIHKAGGAGRREGKNSAASLAAAPAKQRPAGLCPNVRYSGFAPLPAPDVDCSRVKVYVVPIQS